MPYVADLHVHSHYSRATSKNLNLESLYRWAKVKGINVVGTGDFTHPGWFDELKMKLQPDGSGFFVLKNPPDDPAIPGIRTSDIDVRFCLTTEISSIYKYGDRVRKNHNLVFAPDLDTVARINHKLASIGNLEADGRPILGLPSRDLLEIVLETSDRACLVPAHIWTPWFSTLGSKAGYDSIEECFRDLTGHLFAVETGLSSDPAMNWKLSALDQYTLISNSDAHSPAKLGREANLLETDLSYDAMLDAFKTGNGFRGTFEFYPEEGKYHHDGHRKCDVSFEPTESLKHDNVCPECGKPLTIGVLHRVEALADRSRPEQPAGAAGYRYIIPLPEVLGEIEDVGPNTKTVRRKYRRVISDFGNEFSLLHEVSVEEIEQKSGPVLAEAVRRIRKNEIHPQAGYDGVFGIIRVFKPGEVDKIRGQLGFFTPEIPVEEKSERAAEPGVTFNNGDTTASPGSIMLNEEQQTAAGATVGAVLVKAGPGTGKTHTLIEWVVNQVETGDLAASEITAVTFTNKASDELKQRLKKRIGKKARPVTVGTFHALCWRWLREKFDNLSAVYDRSNRNMTLRLLFPDKDVSERKELAEQTGRFLELDEPPEQRFASHIDEYRRYLRQHNAVDLSGLIRRTVEELEDNEWLSELRIRCKALAVDEFQDINPMQYKLIKLIGNGQNLLAIGDADQAIYGFRGSDVSLFMDFADDFDAQEISLRSNYRSAPVILKASGAVIRNNSRRSDIDLDAVRSGGANIQLFEAENPFREADYILDRIRRYVGGTESLTTGTHTDSDHNYGFGDIAVLFRTNMVGDALFSTFVKAGIPVHFGDGTAFLGEPPFTVVARFLQLAEQPDNRIILSDLLNEAYDWKVSQITSLLQIHEADTVPLFGDDILASVPGDMQKDLSDLREKIEDIRTSVKAGNIAEAVGRICDSYINNDLLDDAQKLKKETLLEIAGEADDTGHFLEQMQLNPYTDAGRLKQQAVHLLTFHAAKGLEFPVVFISAAEEGITPVLRNDSDIEEERRLFYVAMTRAEDELQITRSRKRIYYGEEKSMEISRFAGEIPDDLVMKVAESRKSTVNKKQQNEQLGLF